MLRVLREMRHALDCGCAGSDHGHALVSELVQIPVGVAARVSIIPAAGVESVTREAIDAGNSGKLRPVQRSVGHDDESCSHPITTIGRNDPPTLFLAPRYVFDLSLKAGVAIQIEFFADTPRMGQDLRRVGILLLRDVAGLLEQRQIDVRLDIALRAGIAVPVPGPAEVPALLDHADVLHARLAQTRARQQASETAADYQNVNRVRQGRAREARFDIRIVDVTTKVALHLDVLFVAIGTDAFVALLAIPGAQRIGIKIKFLLTIASGQNFLSITHSANSRAWPRHTQNCSTRKHLERYPSRKNFQVPKRPFNFA